MDKVSGYLKTSLRMTYANGLKETTQLIARTHELGKGIIDSSIEMASKATEYKKNIVNMIKILEKDGLTLQESSFEIKPLDQIRTNKVFYLKVGVMYTFIFIADEVLDRNGQRNKKRLLSKIPQVTNMSFNRIGDKTYLEISLYEDI